LNLSLTKAQIRSKMWIAEQRIKQELERQKRELRCLLRRYKFWLRIPLVLILFDKFWGCDRTTGLKYPLCYLKSG